MSEKIPSEEERNAFPTAAAANVASLYRRILKVSISLSLVFGVLALSLYAAEYYYRQHVYEIGIEKSPSFVRFTHFAYAMGWAMWILTGLFAYLGPYLLAKYWGAVMDADDSSSQASYLDSALLVSKRTALWGLVVGPSVGVFVYTTWVEVPQARFTLYGDELEYSPTSAFDWASVLILASAVPAGTAGMISMGIYCFGAVARHSPLWSAYLVLPSESTNTGCVSNKKHSNLMIDVLRLHQISGYITFWFFFIHSMCYVLIYGFEGLYENAAANDDDYLSDNYTFQLDNLEGSAAGEDDDSNSPGFIVLFLQAAWRAIVPPPECFPLTGPGRDYTWNPFWEEEGEDHSHDHDSADSFMGQEWDYDPCYGLYRNFQGLLALIAVLILVLTSLNFVRRWSYRFFYVMHILTATMMVVTMCLHYQRIVFYIFPSLVMYFATTIPTVVQGWFSAYANGGVEIDEWYVLETSKLKAKKKSIYAFGNDDNRDGVLELTFVVDPKSGEALEATATDSKVSYRPKSVRICIPSISLLWYPFTVIEQTPIETAKGQTAFRCTVLLGTVGYFTKSLWKKFHDLQTGIDMVVASQKKVASSSDGNNEDKKQQRQPLVLVDGFYSGATDWIKDAMSHDSLLIAAGGTGVTPFLAFLPQILSLVNNPASDNAPIVSFLWCCRDEALIRHVVKAYLLPLVERAQKSKQSSGAKLRLMIYNTSRKTYDDTPLDLSKAQSPCKVARDSRRGAIMQPSTVQYHPRLSDPTQMAQAATTFMSIAIVGVAVFVWQWHHIYDDTRPRRSFGVRLHGLYVIVAWSFVVAIGVEVYKRYNSGGAANAGSAAPGGGSSTSSDKEDAEELESAEESDDSLGAATKNLRLTSVVPGKAHCYPKTTEDEQTIDQPVLELILSNGRPVLGNTENMCSYWMKRSKSNDESVEKGETGKVPTPSEVALSELAGANHPGVFYCGADKLLEAIQKCVKEGQKDKRRKLKNSASGITKITDCVYYKESFEM